MIEITNYSYLYKNSKGIKNVNLKIEESGLYCLIGENGAGKSTLINGICGITKSNGEISVCNTNDYKKFLKYISYMSDKEGTELVGSFYQLIRLFKNKSIFDFNYFKNTCSKFGLDYSNETKIASSSRGQTKLFYLIFTFSFNHPIYILDEPFSNIDLENKEIIKDLITEIKNRGKIIIISSHELDDIEGFTDHAIFIFNSEIKKVISKVQLSDEQKTLKEIYFELCGDKND